MAIFGSGTTAKVLADLDGVSGYTGQITITDNLYDVATLIEIQNNATGKIVLQKAAISTLEGTAADLKTALDGIAYTGPINVTDSAAAADVNILAKLTTGKVTAEVSETDAAALVTALPDAEPTDALTLTVTGTRTAAQLKALDAKTSVAIDATTVTDITGNAADVKTVLAATTINTADNVVLNVTGTVSAADANVIAGATSGVVTATVAAATAASLNAALKNASANDLLTLELTGTTATAKDLKELDAKTSVTIDATDIETITGTLSDVTTVLGSGIMDIATDVAVTITGTLTSDDIVTLNAIVTDGTIKATVEGTVAELVTLTTAATDAITLKITDDSTTAANLIILDAATSVTVNASAIKDISGAAADLKTIYASKTISGLGNEVVTITAPASADDVNAILKATTGKVTATVTAADAESLNEDLKDAKPTDALTLTVSTGTVAASDLKALDAKTSVAVDADVADLVITGNAADVKTVLASSGITLDKTTAGDAVAVNVTGTVSAADANTIAKATVGVVTATVAAGTAASLKAALVDAAATDALTLKVTGTAAAADLTVLDGKTSVNVDASKVTAITGTLAEVKAVLDSAVIDTAANVAVTITGTLANANIADLNLVAAATTGKVTATVADTAANLKALTTVATDAITLKTTEASATASDLLALDDLTSVVVDAKTVTTITADAADVADVATVLAAKTIAKAADVAVTITNEITALQANSIAKLTTGVVTAEVAGSAATLNALLKDAKSTDKLTLTVSAGTVAASDLKALDAKTSVAVDADAAGITITGNAADVKTVLAADGITTNANVAVTVTGTVSAADANTITGATAGNVTATVAAGTAANLNTALANATTGTDALTLTVNGATATAIALNELNDKTSVDVKVDAIEVTGEFTDLNALYVTDKAYFTALGNENVKITDTVSATNANTIANATSGKVTATVTAADADALNTALTAATATDVLTLTVNGATATAADLNALDGKTSVDVIVDALAVTGDFADLNKVYVTNKANFANLGTENVTIEDTTVTAAQANTIANATTGVVTADVAAATAATLNSALKNAVATDALTLTVNGATATAADLNALDGKTSVDVTVDAAAVTGSFTDLNKVYVTNAANFEDLGDENVTITDKTVSAADANTIANATSGKVTATVTAADADALNTALTAATATDVLTLTVNGATATAADLNALDGKTSVKVKVDATKVTGSFAELETIYVTNKANFANLGNENIEIAPGATAEEINTIANLTTGKVTASLADTAANLVTALKNSASSDELTLTVNGETAKAADLITLDGKTSEDITVSATAVTGTYAELIKVYETNENNFAALGDENITITDKTVTVAQLNAIKDLTSGTVTATVVAASAAALTDLDSAGTDAITLTVSGTTAAAADLNILDGKTSVEVNVSAVTTITGDEAELEELYVTNADNFTGLGNETVTISGTVDSDGAIDNILAATSGKVTATVTAADADALNTALTAATATDVLTLTVNGATATAAHLDALDGKTSVAVKVDATQVTGTFTELNKVYVTNKANFANLGTENVTIEDTTVTAAQANTIASATTGVVTATVAAATAATLNAALTDTTVNAYALELTDTNLSSLTNLIALDGKTTGTVDAGSLLTISETFANLTTVYTSAGISELGNEAVTITDTQSAANVNTFALETIGNVTATITDGAVASTLAAISTNVVANDVITFKTTDTTVDASNLVDLKVLVDTFNTASVTKITETATSVSIVDDALDILGADTQTTAVEITGGAISAADLNTIATNTAGVVTAELAANTQISDATVTALTNVNVSDVVSLTSTEFTADATALVALAAKVSTADAVAFASLTTITETAASVASVDNALDILGADTQTTNVQITGGTITKTEFDLIDTNTAGSIDVSGITLAANDASAINLANLSSVTGLLTLNTVDSDGGDAINAITGSGAGGAITAADILALTGTTLTGDADDVIALAITGDAADTINLTGWTETGAGTKVYTNVVADGAFSDTYTITVTGMVVTA